MKMAKMKGRPKTSERQDVSIRYDKILAGRARQVSQARGISMAEYLTEMTRATVNKDFGKLLKELDQPGDPE